MKLKTLKDLDESNGNTELWSHHAHLRQEAIKWIKYSKTIYKPITFDWEQCFRNFFNITEGEL